MITLGNNEVTKAFLGSTEVKKICLGSEQVWPVESALPYDAEIEYLQSNSLAYIDTGIAGNNNNLVITAKWMISTWNGGGCIYSNFYTTSVNMTRLYFSSTTGNILGGINTKGGSEVTVTGINTNTVYTTIAGRGYLTVNGIKTTRSAGNKTANSRNIVLFNRSTDMLNDKDLGAKLYFFKIEVNGSTLRDMIPVRVGSVGYMYDKVSGQLFGNAGTGSFVLGNDVN